MKRGNSTTALKSRNHFNPHFSDEETESEKNNFIKVLELVYNEAKKPRKPELNTRYCTSMPVAL